MESIPKTRLTAEEYRQRFLEKHGQQYFRDAKKKSMDKHRALGLCIGCSTKAEQSRVRCSVCLKKRRKQTEERNLKLRLKGLCLVCLGKAIKGASYCAKCWDKVLNNARRNVIIRRREHRCVACGSPLIDDERTACYHCITKTNRIRG